MRIKLLKDELSKIDETAAERDALSKQHSVLFVAKAGSGYARDPFMVQIAVAVGAHTRELSKS